MMTSADKVGGWVNKGQNHDDVILEWSLSMSFAFSSNRNISDWYAYIELFLFIHE